MHINDLIKVKNKLNPKLWDGLKLKPEVQKKLLEISDYFLEFASIKKSFIDDILFVGSNTNYNWNDKSDIDLHILLNYEECEDCFIFKVKECVDYIKKDFNDSYNITIYDIPVELYIQEKSEILNSSSIFSLKTNKWIKKPVRIQDVDVDVDEIKDKYLKIKKSLSELSNYEKLDDIFKEIVKNRKTGLKSKNGEFDEHNLLFKLLRSNDVIKQIKDKRNKLLSDKLSLEKENE